MLHVSAVPAAMMGLSHIRRRESRGAGIGCAASGVRCFMVRNRLYILVVHTKIRSSKRKGHFTNVLLRATAL